MVMLVWSYGRKELSIFLSTVNPLTGRKPRIGLAADKVTDAGGVQCEIVNARFNYNGAPITVCLALAEIGDDYGDGVAEAGGFSCFQKIVEILEEHGIECFVGEGADAASMLNEHGQHDQISCFVSDGEQVYRSEEMGVFHYFHHEDGIGDPTILTHWDPPHAIDILKSHAQSDYVSQTHVLIKAVWSHFLQSQKRSRQLDKFVAKHAADWLNLHYLFPVRFVESEYKSLLAFAKDLALVVKFLRREQSDKSTEPNMLAKIVGWLRMLTSLKFIATLLTSIDIDEQLKILPKETQSDRSLVIYYPEQRRNCLSRLTQLQSDLGENSKARLADLKQKRYKFDKVARPLQPQVLVRNDEPDDGDDDDALGPGGAPTSTVLHPETDYIDIHVFGVESGDIAGYLLKYQKEQVDHMVAEFDTIIADVDVFTHLATIFRFDEMLTELKRGLSHSSTKLLLAKVDASIDYLIAHRYKSLDPYETKTEWQRVFHWLCEKWQLFWDEDAVPDTASSKTKAKWRASPFLNLVGNGGVFGALFQSEGPSDIAGFLLMSDDMISLRTCQSDTERAGIIVVS